MYVVVQHAINDPATAFPRGEALMRHEGAPAGARVLQFLPSADSSAVTCLWEAESVGSIQGYVDTVLGDSSDNHCYEVLAEKAFAERPGSLPTSPAAVAQ